MSGLAALAVSIVGDIVTERIKTKTGAVSAVPLAATAAVYTGATPIAPDSIEGMITQVVTGLLGLYLLFKKG